MSDRCPTCNEPWAMRGFMGETLVGYYSPPGHDHNDNCLVRTYACPNGHRFSYALRRRCPACDWVGKSECFCHTGQKLDAWPDAPDAPDMETARAMKIW